MAKRDYYEVLGIDRGVAKDDIKRAYRKIAVANHPDRNPGDKAAEERFKEATEAYEILADEKRRQAYDQFGFAGVEGMGGGPGAGGFTSAFRDFEDLFGDFGGIFDSFFGGSGGRRRGGGRESVQRGSDLRYDLEIEFTEAAFGTKKEVSYPKEINCDRCHGAGSEPGSGKKTCPTCGGAGQVRRSSGFFSIASACPTCGGEGSIVEKPCSRCGGNGLLKKNQKINVTIPAGVEDGRRIRIPEQGDAGPRGGPPGDLYVVIRVRSHEFFERDGFDIYCVIPVSFTQAALGAELLVPTLDGKRVKVKIPPGTENNKILRLRNEGISHASSGRRGDMYLRILVKIPRKLSSKAKTLLKEFAEVEGEDASPKPVPLSDLR
ncbi:MAG: molecular chaperone DnaJ [Spirochaetaceae bacterium]|nr:molecular chaperone DnaJ [Spirochaetaceae bacterium]